MSSSDQTVNRYDPRAYWNAREHPNTAADPGLSPQEIDFLNPKIASARSLLEIGPGVGRLFPLYRDTPRVCTVDLSVNYRDRAREAARRAGILVHDHYLDDARAPLPFADGEFALGITSHVLMHVPFENIEWTMSEAARVCRRVAVISARHRFWPRKGQTFDPKWHCFAHDYEAICKTIGCAYGGYQVFVERPDDGAYGFVFGRNAADII